MPNQLTPSQQQQAVTLIIDLPRLTREIDGYADVASRAKAYPALFERASAFERQVDAASDALKRLNVQVRAACSRFVMDVPDHPQAAEVREALTRASLGGYDWKDIVVISVAAAAAVVLFILNAPWLAAVAAFVAVFNALAKPAVELLDAVARLAAPSVNPDGSVNPTIAQVASEGLGAAKVLGLAAVVGLALWLFKGRRRNG